MHGPLVGVRCFCHSGIDEEEQPILDDRAASENPYCC